MKIEKRLKLRVLCDDEEQIKFAAPNLLKPFNENYKNNF